MRIRIIIGIALIVVGAFILIRGLSYTSQRDVLQLGDLKASVEQKRTIPPWVGGVVIAGGLLLAVTGFGRRSAT